MLEGVSTDDGAGCLETRVGDSCSQTVAAQLICLSEICIFSKGIEDVLTGSLTVAEIRLEDVVLKEIETSLFGDVDILMVSCLTSLSAASMVVSHIVDTK